MPYISAKDRQTVSELDPSQPGELNYVITRLIYEYMLRRGKSYATMNEIVGALDCAKLEFYRRVMTPYEDEKCRENGDVFK